MPKPTIPPLDVLQRYTINEACSYLRVSRATLYKCIHAGKLPIIKEGRRTFVPGRVIAERSAPPEAASDRAA
jgi:excisionase family DNA binding protein